MAPPSSIVLEQPIFTRRKLRVVAIGAGFANLILAHKHKFGEGKGYIDLVLYEKNAGIGGTWFENRYPGVKCDVPAHIYTFPFAPNPDWSSFYVGGPEILDYINKTADDYQLNEYVHLESKVTSAIWSSDKGKWQIKIDQQGHEFRDEADILINGAGILNRWQWPSIPGLDTFRGKLVHSAQWDTELDWADKNVGLIGNGSSAIQILPQIQPKAKSVGTYIRSPTWIIPNFLAELTPEGRNFEYTEQQKREFREQPEKLRELRRKMEHAINSYFVMLMKDSPQQHAARETLTKAMREQLGGDTELAERLVPNFPVGCRRITPGDGYLDALKAENVTVHFGDIVEFQETGILSQPTADNVPPELNDYEIIVCATGFDVSFVPAWEMKGLNGVDLRALWKDSAEGYMGLCAPEMPNYFIFNGPNCPIGHGSLMACMDFAADYILRWCDKIASQGIKSVLPRPLFSSILGWKEQR
ncbi:flavin-binding monooxygenase like protein [Zymoseptoria brevis]|uniref:Flavin-binding monooxygenase like protein n=1 Tax=Zymoseptoria brevis TaxID=1047168 RepID=A0A0F4GG83_9PEZI|nr:flavin-binding monooxygenase like protein [Zymoseptoria brevis]